MPFCSRPLWFKICILCYRTSHIFLLSCRLRKQQVFSLAVDVQCRLQIVSKNAAASQVGTKVKFPSAVYQHWKSAGGIPEARICFGWEDKKHLVCSMTTVWKLSRKGSQPIYISFWNFVYINVMCGAVKWQQDCTVNTGACIWRPYSFALQLTYYTTVVNIDSCICYDYLTHDQKLASQQLC